MSALLLREMKSVSRQHTFAEWVRRATDKRMLTNFAANSQCAVHNGGPRRNVFGVVMETQTSQTPIPRRFMTFALGLAAAALLAWPAPYAGAAAGKKPTEDDYYRIVPLPIPDNVVLECGGLEMMPDGRLAV